MALYVPLIKNLHNILARSLTRMYRTSLLPDYQGSGLAFNTHNDLMG